MKRKRHLKNYYIKHFFLFLIYFKSYDIYCQDKSCPWHATFENNIIVDYKSNSFSFKAESDTTWLYVKNYKTKKLKKRKILSITSGSDSKKYNLFKIENYLFLQVKQKNKIMFYDTLVNIKNVQNIKSYSLGSNNYTLKDRLYYLDTNYINNSTIKQSIKDNFFIINTTYANISKFTRWFISRNTLTIDRMEICYKVSPFCPLNIIFHK